MGIIDAHVHLGKRHLPCEEVSGLLKRHRVERAVIFADPESPDISADNEYVLEVAKENIFFPFYYIGGNAYGTNRVADRLSLPRNFSQYCGVKWHCWYSPSHDLGFGASAMSFAQAEKLLDDDDFNSVMALLEASDKPISFEECFEVTCVFVSRFPKLKIIIPHMGSLNGGKERVLKEFRIKSNVYFDTSLAHLDMGIVDLIGPHRLIYGSDYPYGSLQQNIRSVLNLDVGETARRLIFGENILNLIGHASRAQENGRHMFEILE